MSSSSDVHAQDLLDAITVALQTGDDIDALMRQSEASSVDVEEFAAIIQSLHAALTPVEPRSEFSESLRSDLIAERPGLVKRLRQMPARVHIAAALALVAGCLLFIMRRLFDSDGPQERQEEAVATPL